MRMPLSFIICAATERGISVGNSGTPSLMISSAVSVSYPSRAYAQINSSAPTTPMPWPSASSTHMASTFFSSRKRAMSTMGESHLQVGTPTVIRSRTRRDLTYPLLKQIWGSGLDDLPIPIRNSPLTILEHRLHRHGRMIVRFKPGQQIVHTGDASFVCDLVHEIGVAFAGADCFEFIRHTVLQHRRHPHHALETSIRGDKLGTDEIELSHAHHAGGLHAATRNARQRGEGHARGGHGGIFARDDHHAIRFRDEHDDAFETSAGSHRVLHDGVHRDLLHHTVRTDLGVVVCPFPVPFFHVDRLAQFDRLIGTRGIDAE